jgi:carboxyl-terminal processing protease
MVDGTSASASEIFAAAIQDYKRGLIIGASSTYGQGTVQRNISLNPDNELGITSSKPDDMGSVKLTLQKFYRINGGATQLRGVVPDVILPDRFDYLKFREKDNPSALKWDEIPHADYQKWMKSSDVEQAANMVSEELTKNTTFNSIKNNVLWLEKYNDREYSLNITKYKQEQKQLKDVVKNLDDLNKLATPMNFTNLTSDTLAINSAEDKIEKNKQWIKFRNTDVYIDESVKAVDKLIALENLAKNK